MWVIRNIIGNIYHRTDNESVPFGGASGAFDLIDYLSHTNTTGVSSGYDRYFGASFSASRVVRTGPDNRPYNIRMLPLICY